jgi:peptidoglycan/xylan/chitin deacetylase (PgdA/CDA1 family)
MTPLRRVLAVAGALSMATLMSSGQAVRTAASTQPTYVSVTIDDGTVADGMMRSPLDQHGIRATWYINSGRIGRSDRFMTWQQIQALAADGQEIAGHTVDHPDLTTVGDAQARFEICDDRRALQARGFAVSDFAYPYAAWNNAARQAVIDCGYTSGRGVGRIGCTGCPSAETIGPADPFVLRTPTAWTYSYGADRYERFVTAAEQNGGGWVILIFHGICTTPPCDPNSISPADLASILEFLQSSARSDAIRIKTVAEVMALQKQPGSDVHSHVGRPPAAAPDPRAKEGV